MPNGGFEITMATPKIMVQWKIGPLSLQETNIGDTPIFHWSMIIGGRVAFCRLWASLVWVWGSYLCNVHVLWGGGEGVNVMFCFQPWYKDVMCSLFSTLWRGRPQEMTFHDVEALTAIVLVELYAMARFLDPYYSWCFLLILFIRSNLNPCEIFTRYFQDLDPIFCLHDPATGIYNTLQNNGR